MKNFVIRTLKVASSKMQTLKYSFIAITLIFLITDGCKKNDPQSTALKIRVIDEQGSSITGVSVTLYKTLADFGNQTNKVGSALISDANGEVVFNNLDPIEYYWFAEKDCLNNANGIATADNLVPNVLKIVTSTLIETGSLELTNQSTSQYQVYINGALLLTADAQFIYSYIYVPAGDYSFRMVQVGGSITRTYTGTITCGNKLSIAFP